jgi:hypothetical protein
VSSGYPRYGIFAAVWADCEETLLHLARLGTPQWSVVHKQVLVVAPGTSHALAVATLDKFKNYVPTAN